MVNALAVLLIVRYHIAMDLLQRIVITGVSLTAPNGNSLTEYRSALLNGKSGVSPYEIRYFGTPLAGI